ncbi:intraflagellar transport protein [Scenedesmus sp. NREL 46B-D3]|nr:intraflagellar transport protein [Scenedesmus sp. NREL 46B-D3]
MHHSKKIAIPGSGKLRCISWNTDQGWIACGGEGALLKVLRLDGATQKEVQKAAAAAAAGGSVALAQNQTLEGHSSAVVCATWNSAFNKLTTSDEAGLIIVWTLYNGMWYEEMINNRNKGVVKDMKWTPNGDKICIAYDDGAVIVGSVDGNRLWGKELSMQLSLLEWSPDGRFILFCNAAGECHTYDSNGNAVAKVPLYCNEGYVGPCKMVGVDWYDGSRGFPEPSCPVLALCLDNGRMQLMRHDMDDNAVCIDTGIKPRAVKWNHNGSILAVSGHQTTGEGVQLWLVQFYSQAGEHLRSLRVPGGGINGICWEGSGLRLALAVDSHIFFTSMRHSYLWAYFADTLVYAFTKPERQEHCVMFWGTRSNERYAKYVKRVTHVSAAGDCCLLATKGEAPGEHILILCNSIGSPVDSKIIEMEPKFVWLTDCYAIAASEEVVYVWQFRNSFTRQLAAAGAAGGAAGSGAAAKLQREGREQMFHIDNPIDLQAPEKFKQQASQLGGSADPICALTAHQHQLLVARSSGVVHGFGLPGLAPEARYLLRCRPARLSLNCDGSRLAVIDFNGVLSFMDLTAAGTGKMRGEHLAHERKDVWDLCWASDNSELLALMEKGRMYVLRGSEPEEPVNSSACLAGFSDLQVHAVFLDDIMQQPDLPELDMVADYETRSLRVTRALLASGNEADAQAFVADNPHKRLWQLLAEHALQNLHLAVAEKAFVHCADYQGVQLVKRLAQLADKAKQQAEVCVYFKRFDDAEDLYRRMDRLDLAIGLRSRLGDWFKVERLLKETGGDDAALVNAWNKIGQYYSDRQKWAKAAQYYTQARNTGMLVQCFYQLEDFPGLVKLTEVLTEGQPLLADIGAKLQSVGLCADAVAAFLKAGDSKAAIDCCVLLHQWDQALQLAQHHNYPQAEGLLQQYAGHLLEKHKYLEAVELYRKAQRHTEAAKLLVDTAVKLAQQRAQPLQIKKLYVLAALEVEAFKRKALAGAGGDGHARVGTAADGALRCAHALACPDAGLMTLEAASGGELRGLDNAWRGAEAYHFWLLAHQQLYNGQADAALRTALRLRQYDDVLDPADVYAFLALVGFYSNFYRTCSKAFVKLEALPSIPKERREAFADLALSIFVAHPPADPHNLAEGRDRQRTAAAAGGGKGQLDALLDDLVADKDQVCVASGKAVRDAPRQRCKTCRRAMITAELSGRRSCPLCHSQLPQEAGKGRGPKQARIIEGAAGQLAADAAR